MNLFLKEAKIRKEKMFVDNKLINLIEMEQNVDID